VRFNLDETELAEFTDGFRRSRRKATSQRRFPGARRSMQHYQAVQRQVRPVYFFTKCEVQDGLRQQAVLLRRFDNHRIPLSNEFPVRQQATVQNPCGIDAT